MSRLNKSAPQNADAPDVSERRVRLALLARIETGVLEAARAEIAPDLPAYRMVKQPETGLAMVQARAGGTGTAFNFGEMSLTRCVVALDDGVLGVGYVAGRDRHKAELVALFDALAQSGQWRARLEHLLFAPARSHQATAQTARAAQVAATRVDFFTMVRGED